MKTFIKYFLSALFGFILVQLLFGYVLAEINPFEWSIENRKLSTFVWVVVFIAICLLLDIIDS